MPATSERPIAIYYEHPDWFRPLFAELERRELPHVRLRADSHAYDVGGSPPPYALLLNRMSPSAYLRGSGHAIFYTLRYLAHLHQLGVRVINGYDAYRVETSKTTQLRLLRGLGLPYPRTRVVNHPGEAPAAATDLRFPVAVKPNIGGSGAGVRRFADPAELERAARTGELDLGPDSTGLVQEFIPAAGDRIVRVEVLGGRFLYAIAVHTTGETFDLCPADICRTVENPSGAGGDGGPCGTDVWAEACTPPTEVVRSVERIAAAAGIEVGGVEYVEDARDGELYYYDINALSNFVADAPRVVGFDPTARLVDYLEREAD